ncbi:hypothetical protein ASPZODRAFT_163132 [Penicilliopsis zonata CBS 506.65]|uniref:Uncharacterized protein n=1 Tax=Penicilliopsis zonata CBS 506.65 TaxID=1073090 RepID=A0A1L9SVV8_9EURO|nr:hypothetical protein ASPZODRAFT_163132 [Penicilliopsis zonata CBS 506.65]OJJ51274.1 hypothetical protein ASPZODRAFT_163132 [Penicilliopsis zonata CBS 506.65]
MSDRPSRPSSSYLEPPKKSVEFEDVGAQETASNSDDDHFSDASEGRDFAHSHPPSGRASPVPRTRVEKVDDEPRYGEVPGTTAYEKRGHDAVPDEIEVIPEGTRSRSHSAVRDLDRPVTPGGTPIPRTLVEKVDPTSPSLGEIPGTAAYKQRKADAVPDLVVRAGDFSAAQSPLLEPQRSGTATPVPETRLSRVDSIPTDELSSRLHAHQRQPSDAMPDSEETIGDVSNHVRSQPCIEESGTEDADGLNDVQDNDDDFDEFAEEQDQPMDDDFGDFDDGFQEPGEDVVEESPRTPPAPSLPPVPQLVDFDTFTSQSDLFAALDDHLDLLYPSSQDLSSLPAIEPIPDQTAIFTTDRSLSLWSQLVAPPPLQPQNWVKSRIRRLFLVSLGVPVDLDEILPASKQKKLVLPSIKLDENDGVAASPAGASGPGPHPRPSSSSQAKKDGGPAAALAGESDTPRSSGQLSRQHHPHHRSTTSSSRRRAASPAPDLDLSAVRRLCATTDAALDGFTDSELRDHLQELERTTLRASTVLEYWLKLRDGLLGEKEAFEGVIENLVSHARRVRK